MLIITLKAFLYYYLWKFLLFFIMYFVSAVELENFKSQKECFEAMFNMLSGSLDDKMIEKFKEAVYLREYTASTFLDNGLAIPHGRIENIEDEYIVVGLSKSGIDWSTEDKKVNLIFLVGINKSKVSTYLYILQRIVSWVKENGSYIKNYSIDNLKQEIEEILSK